WADSPRSTSGFSTRRNGSGACPAFLIFESVRVSGRKSATAAALTTAGPPPAPRSGGRDDLDDADARRVRELDVRGHQGDLGAPGRRGLRQRVALPSRGPVTQEPDRVEFFPGTARGDQHVPAAQVGAQPRGA